MSFSVRLSNDLIPVEAGATVPVSIEVVNKGSETDRYELQFEGIDTEWTAVPEAVFTVEAGETHSEKAFIKVPRASESVAGNYPFVLRVRSLNSGEARSAQGVVQVKPFHYLTMEMSPKKGMYSPTRRQNSFAVTILNLGNTTHTLQLFGNDPDEACTYEFESDQMTIDPGQQRTVELEVVPSSTRFLSSSRLHGFSISGRSVETPTVMTSAQGQLEQRPFVTPASLTFLLFLLIIGIGWFALLPKPPTIALTLGKRQAVKGESVRVTWRAQNANSVQILVNGNPLVADPPLNGETEYIAEQTGDMVFSARAIRDSKESPEDAEVLKVVEPAPSPKPLVTLKAKRRTINLGESVELTYSLTNAIEAYLQPTGQKLPLSLTTVSVQPTVEGTMTYEIVATGKDNQVDRASVQITVVDKARVVILAFEAKPPKLEVGGGYVTVSWQVSNAARIEITGGPETIVPENPNSPGSQEIMIDKSTSFTLKAIDATGKSVSKTVKIEVASPVEPPTGTQDPPTSPPTTTGTTTGGGR